jgi:flagellar hook-basal body complex protein FliE
VEIQKMAAFENKFDLLMDAAKPQQAPNNVMFEGIMNGITEMKTTQEVGKLEMSQVLLGNSDNAHNALISLEKANLQMMFASSVRDKATQGLNQMLNMQV